MTSKSHTYTNNQVEARAITVRVDLDSIGLVGRESILAKASCDVRQVTSDRFVDGNNLDYSSARSARTRAGIRTLGRSRIRRRADRGRRSTRSETVYREDIRMRSLRVAKWCIQLRL